MNKPKIGIMTFYAAHNNGAALQAFALQRCLSKLGADAELIRYFDEHNEKVVEKHSRLYNLIHNPKIILNVLLHYKRILKTRGLSVLTDAAYSDFQKRKLIVSQEPYYKYDELKGTNTVYNSFVTGSDMVWTPIGQNLRAYFLRFADNGKRFSFSPSLTGVGNFSDDQHRIIQKYINEMDMVSCREQEGVDYVKDNTSKDCVHTIDPTLLLSKKEWCEELNIEINKSLKPYILVYMFDSLSRRHKKDLERIAKEKGYLIRYIPMNIEQQEIEVDNGYWCSYGPSDFVTLFMNACFIVTNTYHGLLFSLLSENPFVLVHRGNSNKWKSNEGRMTNVLDLINCRNRYIEQQQSISDIYLNLDYKGINSVIDEQRSKSLEYLSTIIVRSNNNPLSASRRFSNVGSLYPSAKNQCTGCGLCSQICPFGAIEMKPDNEGFLFPFVNEQLCKRCRICVSRCPSISKLELNEPIDAKACISKDALLENSASGGAFLGFARYTIEKMHGSVFGSVFDDKMNCVHTEATTMKEIRAIQKSKYVQSNIVAVYERVKDLLDKDKFVLFSGTPCQVAGLLAFVGNKTDNLFTIDLICHGVPSPGFWKKYLFNSYPSQVTSFSFRNRNNRRKGTSSYEIEVSCGGKSKKISCFKDVFFKSFLKGFSFRESCYYCKYARPQRVGDITIGDFDSERQYPLFYPHESKSVVIINTQKGYSLFNKLKREYEFIDIDYNTEVLYNSQLKLPSVRPVQREDFYLNLSKNDWDTFKEKYL